MVFFLLLAVQILVALRSCGRMRLHLHPVQPICLHSQQGEVEHVDVFSRYIFCGRSIGLDRSRKITRTT